MAGRYGRLGFVPCEESQIVLNRRDLPGQISRVDPNNALFNTANGFLVQQTTVFDTLPGVRGSS